MDFFKDLFKSEDKIGFTTLLNGGAILLDVRTELEYSMGHIINSINIPLDNLSSNIAKLDKDASIIVVCQSGIRSKNAISILKRNGFTNIHDGVSWTYFK